MRFRLQFLLCVLKATTYVPTLPSADFKTRLLSVNTMDTDKQLFFLSTEPITVICLESQSEAPRGFDRSNAIPDRNRADRTRGI